MVGGRVWNVVGRRERYGCGWWCWACLWFAADFFDNYGRRGLAAGGAVQAGENKMAIWDFETINREVPIEAVLEMHGIFPSEKMRGGGWYSIRSDDDTPSAHIDTQRRFGNTIHDFGYGNTFTPLSLTMYLQGVDKKEASRILGEAFHIPPMAKGGEDNSNVVSDFDWRRLGIYPDMASKNIDFNLEKYVTKSVDFDLIKDGKMNASDLEAGGASSTMKLAMKYRISMSELRERAIHPKDATQADARDKRQYESILRNRAVPFAHEKRDAYYRRMFDDYSLARAVSSEFDADKVYELHHTAYEEMARELTNIEAAMKKALDGTSVKYKGRRYDARKDFEDVINGEISFEIGWNSHYEVSRSAYFDKTKVFYCIVSMDEFYTLSKGVYDGMENASAQSEERGSRGIGDVQVAAKQKGDQVTLSFSARDANRVHNYVKALRGKEIPMTENLTEVLVVEKGMNDLDRGAPIR